MIDPLFSLEHVSKTYHADREGRRVKALDDVNFSVSQGICFGVIGESGSGKTTIARLLVGLLAPDTGRVAFRNHPVPCLGRQNRKTRYFTQVQMVFQDTYGTLNPYRSTAEILGEALRNAQVPKVDWTEKMKGVCDLVGFPWAKKAARPGELSGGLRQRLSIARALVFEPCALVLDEPVASLDLSIQARILNLLQELRRELGLTYVFISHDLDIIEHTSDEIGIIYQGRVVEVGGAKELLRNPQHEYSKTLLATQAHHYAWHSKEEM